MKQFLKWFVLCLLALCAAMPACAEEAEPDMALPVFVLPAGDSRMAIRAEWINEECWLFLPAFAQPEQLTAVDGELEWWDTEPDEDGLWYVDFIGGEQTVEVMVMRSENLRTLFLISDDPENHGISYIEKSPTRRKTEAPASLIMVDTDGSVSHREHIEALRGRGNGTWVPEKRSYQMKLDNSVDLLDTGLAQNRAKRWLLISEVMDETMLHNQISMDLGRELGLTVMESEFVDLYYDGLYRGLYRLSEKVEVGEGRVDILDYDEMLKRWNKKIGQSDLDLLPAGEGVNRFGNRYTYVENVVDNHLPVTGSYMIEMEDTKATLSDRCYFRLSDSPETQVYALKNPENASRQAVEYVSERLQEAQDILKAGGVHPETGETAGEAFDLDAFARTLMVQELSGNFDGYTYSSSFFILPAGEKRFEPGPLWDLDLAYRLRTDGSTAYAMGFKDETGWLPDFYQVPEFMRIANRIYQQEMFPLIQNVLLGEEKGRYLRSLDEYIAHIAASEKMNDLRWTNWRKTEMYFSYTYEGELWQLRSWIDRRSRWMSQVYEYLAAAPQKYIELWAAAPFVSQTEKISFVTVPWQNCSAELLSACQLTEATEDSYARWQAQAKITALDGGSLEGYTVSLNGTPLTASAQEDGTLMICFEYDDQSYRPVDYYGQDVGRIYQYERYIEYYPEIAKALDYDEESVMDYFFDEGIYEGQAGNEFFEAREIAWRHPDVEDYLGEEWDMYYWEYLDWGYDAEWLPETHFCYLPQVSDAEKTR